MKFHNFYRNYTILIGHVVSRFYIKLTVFSLPLTACHIYSYGQKLWSKLWYFHVIKTRVWAKAQESRPINSTDKSKSGEGGG